MVILVLVRFCKIVVSDSFIYEMLLLLLSFQRYDEVAQTFAVADQAKYHDMKLVPAFE
jgi:hypothetical protein